MRNAKSNKQGSEEKLVIDVYDGASLLDPATDFFLVEDLVEFTRKTFTTSKRGRPVEQVCTFTLHGLHCKKRPAIPTGLVPAVADRLREAGIDVSIRDHRKFGPAHKTSRQVWADSNGDDRRLLQAVKRHPLGQIEMSGTAAMVQQLHLIRRYFPKARILIVVATGDSARYLRRELGKLAEDGVKLKTGLWPRRPPRCLITTYPPLATCKPEQWDIVVLPYAEHATQTRFSGAMGVFHGSPYRCYSFVRPGQPMGRRSRIRLAAISGQVIYEIEPGRPAMEVLWLQPPKPGANGYEKRSLDWKRTAFWHNDRRNEYIASVARAFAKPNLEKLRKYGVRFQGDSPAFTSCDAPGVVLLVESTEHGRELLKRLDGWVLMDRAAGKRNRATNPNAKGKIITATRAAADGLDADVIIQAVGGAGIGVFQNTVVDRNTDAGCVPALTVDFNDSGDDMAAADARGRMRAYERLGWKQHGCPARSSPERENRAAARQKEVAP